MKRKGGNKTRIDNLVASSKLKDVCIKDGVIFVAARFEEFAADSMIETEGNAREERANILGLIKGATRVIDESRAINADGVFEGFEG